MYPSISLCLSEKRADRGEAIGFIDEAWQEIYRRISDRDIFGALLHLTV